MPMMPRVSILKGPPGFGVGLVLVHLQGLVGLEDLWNHRGVDFFLTRENAQGGTKPRVNRTTHFKKGKLASETYIWSSLFKTYVKPPSQSYIQTFENRTCVGALGKANASSIAERVVPF